MKNKIEKPKRKILVCYDKHCSVYILASEIAAIAQDGSSLGGTVIRFKNSDKTAYVSDLVTSVLVKWNAALL